MASVRRPSSIPVDYIPDELKQRPQWVTWQYLDGQKVPFAAATGKAASSTNPATWATFDCAVQAYLHRRHAGIGYVFAADDPYVGIDLDDCRDANGELLPQDQELVAGLNTYAEVSPSGTGVKLIARGRIPKNVTPTPLGDGMHVELYDHARYFTITGQHLAGTPTTINDADAALTALYALLRPAPALPPSAPPRPLPATPADAAAVRRWCLAALTYEQEKMLAAQDGEKHQRRFDSAHALGGLVHTGGLSEQEIFAALDVNHGPNVANAHKAIWDGITAGMAHPRESPALRPLEELLGSRVMDQGDVVVLPRQDYDRLRRENEQLNAWRAWALMLSAIPTERLSPTAKVAAFILWPEMASRTERGVEQPAPIWIEALATRAGLSPGTYGKKLKELADVGALLREETKDPVTGHSKVLIAPAAFYQPDAWAPPEPRNHGGTDRTPGCRPAPACPTCGPEAPVVAERTVITRTLCGTCDTELAAHTFTQQRATRWSATTPDDDMATRHAAGRPDTGANATDPNPQLGGWADEVDDERVDQRRAGWLDARAGADQAPPNPQGDGQEDLPSTLVPQVAGWGLQAAAEQTGADQPAHPTAPVVPDAVASLLDDVANLPGVRAGLIAPDDPYFAYLRVIATRSGSQTPPSNTQPEDGDEPALPDAT